MHFTFRRVQETTQYIYSCALKSQKKRKSSNTFIKVDNGKASRIFGSPILSLQRPPVNMRHRTDVRLIKENLLCINRKLYE